ncbi:DUF1240 domain-containing protein [Citrobacter enshiensis]|uniref:DUF1240 domain-containing protein n=1 Tax=Citrobacter enshiensis TaxID=2971264 RepID=UPI0023E78B0C|nr:DUF1240 domain-containing protein [Citrobacter enshiensis]WET42300.1 DUF1240 domain-containing protein [Citrobacter enshiensis]
MINNNELKMKDMTLKEKVKFILSCIISIAILTGALIFLFNIFGSAMIDAFRGTDTLYYDWRAIFILLLFPVMGYFDVLVFFLLFTPYTLPLAQFWYKKINIVWGYSIVAFILSIPLSLVIFIHIHNTYDSCGKGGFLSGDFYAKDPKMCEQFEYHPEKDKSDDSSTAVIPTDTKVK